MRGKYADDAQSLAAKVVILVTSFIALPFVITATSYQPWFYSDGYGGIADGMSLIPICWSILWTLISLSIKCCGKMYHPGVNIAMELAAIGMAIGTVWLLIYWTDHVGVYEACQKYNGPGLEHHQCSLFRAEVIKASEVIVATMIIILIFMHLFLLVKACRVTHILEVERKRKRAARKSSIELQEQDPHMRV